MKFNLNFKNINSQEKREIIIIELLIQLKTKNVLILLSNVWNCSKQSLKNIQEVNISENKIFFFDQPWEKKSLKSKKKSTNP